MPTQAQLQPLTRQVQSYLTRLRAKLKYGGLLHVLESFPEVGTFTFFDARILGEPAICFRLGFRPQVDDVLATSWAFVLLASTDNTPPVLFRDEAPSVSRSGAPPQLTPRSAASLLRKAERLEPPFCFLQFDPHDNATNVRGMLCAVVLDYSLLSGLSDHALKWSSFEGSFFQALTYIKESFSFQQWRDGGVQISKEAMQLDGLVFGAGSDSGLHTTGADLATPAKADSLDVTCIRSLGSAIDIQSGTDLAKFKILLGNEFGILDAIPPLPVVIKPQDVFPDYFPYRLHIGTYRDVDAYLYPIQNGNGKITIVAHDAGGISKAWNLFELNGLELFEPFATLMRPVSLQARTRGNRIRYMVYYYYMLAENAGLSGSPRFSITESMIPTFLSSCRYLKSAIFDPTNTPLLRPSKGLRTVLRRSLIVKLILPPASLAMITDMPLRTSSAKLSSSEEKQRVPRRITNLSFSARRDEQAISAATSIGPSQSLHNDKDANAISRKLTGGSNHHSELLAARRSRDLSHDSGFASSRASPAHLAIMTSADQQARPKPSPSLVASPALDQNSVQHRAVSPLTMTSGVDAMEVDSTVQPRTPPPPVVIRGDPTNVASKLKSYSHIIDLCSDEDDDEISDPHKFEVELTPEVEELFRVHHQASEIIDDDELRMPARKTRNRIPTQPMSEDDDIMQVDGRSWKLASRRRDLGSPLLPPD
ncbi:hypothetical protein FB567DRAFT_346206 [Paraphoma chrysanthemicola]|uniref:Uncharacterized protein n=1 Tax=Paraphoma chrysanthemicola TaxID=798071 RepID=A0A8K0VZF5_9PLEO|nr:hypothetical protein FB567DRAFT_346206 [Paraphoma chrysanthemicola]